MSNSTYMGLPRNEIPWFPTINYDLCISCGACMDFCDHEVYKKEDDKIIVANPFNCVVGCKSCYSECNSGALSFPTKEELAKILNTLREKYKK